MQIPKRLKRLMCDIMEKSHSDEEWFMLRRETDLYIAILPKELRDYFAESGAGEMLYMHCSGIEYDKALKSYGVVIDEYDGNFLSWGQLEPGETLEYDPKTQSYKRSCELNKT